MFQSKNKMPVFPWMGVSRLDFLLSGKDSGILLQLLSAVKATLVSFSCLNSLLIGQFTKELPFSLCRRRALFSRFISPIRAELGHSAQPKPRLSHVRKQLRREKEWTETDGYTPHEANSPQFHKTCNFKPHRITSAPQILGLTINPLLKKDFSLKFQSLLKCSSFRFLKKTRCAQGLLSHKQVSLFLQHYSPTPAGWVSVA